MESLSCYRSVLVASPTVLPIPKRLAMAIFSRGVRRGFFLNASSESKTWPFAPGALLVLLLAEQLVSGLLGEDTLVSLC